MNILFTSEIFGSVFNYLKQIIFCTYYKIVTFYTYSISSFILTLWYLSQFLTQTSPKITSIIIINKFVAQNGLGNAPIFFANHCETLTFFVFYLIRMIHSTGVMVEWDVGALGEGA